MAKYDFDEISIGIAGWNALADSNFDKVETHLHTYLETTGGLGESVSTYEAICFYPATEKWVKALANKSKQPAWGLAIEDGVTDEVISIQRIGPITNTGWSWTAGKPVYLSAATPGALTQTPPADDFRQYMGLAISSTTIILDPEKPNSLWATTTTTTTSTSTTTTTTA